MEPEKVSVRVRVEAKAVVYQNVDMEFEYDPEFENRDDVIAQAKEEAARYVEGQSWTVDYVDSKSLTFEEPQEI